VFNTVNHEQTIHFRMLVLKKQYYWSRDQLMHKLFSFLFDAHNSRDFDIIVVVN